jgi:uncharacterized protein (DUF3820 family)
MSNIDKKSKNKDIFEEKVGKLLKKSLNIQVNGEINHYLAESIKIDGIDNLIKKLKEFTKNEVLESNKILLEQVKYQGMSVVEKKINNND